MEKGFVLHPAMPASLPLSMPDGDRASTKRGREEKGLLPSLPANHVELAPLVMHRMFSGR